MPVINVEYAKEAEGLKSTEASFYKQVHARKLRNWRRQIVLAALALTAVMLRFGIPTKELPIVNPSNATTPITDAADFKWYEHPVALYVVGVLMAPVMLLSIVVAAEPYKDKVPFFTVVNRKYCDYLRGMFTVSLLVDSTQLFVRGNPPATLYSALHSYFQGNEWIDPYTSNDQLWTVSYQATITAFVSCYCLMLINKSMNHRLARHPFPNVILRTAAIGFVVAVVVLVSQDCYFAYIKSRDYTQCYFVSVLMGMVIAILEVQGTKDYEAPLKRYRVIMRNIKNAKGRNDKTAFGLDPNTLTQLDNQSSTAKKIEQIAMQCYLYCKQSDMAFKNYPFVDSRLSPLFSPIFNPDFKHYSQRRLKDEDTHQDDIKLDMELEFNDSGEKTLPQP